MSDQVAAPAVVWVGIDAYSQSGTMGHSEGAEMDKPQGESAVGIVRMERAVAVVRLIKALEEA